MKQLFKARFGRAAAVMSVCALGLISTAFAKGKQDFTLHNNTGMVITELYISDHEKTDWEEDVLGVDVLGDGEETEVTFDPDEEADEWDLKIVDDKGKDWVWSNLTLTDITDVTLYIDDKGVRRARLKKVD